MLQAPHFTASGELWVLNKIRFPGRVRCLYLADRPANLADTRVAAGYCVTSLNIHGYLTIRRTHSTGIQNLLDREESKPISVPRCRIVFAAAPLTENHFTPGTKFYLKGALSSCFFNTIGT